MTLTQSRFEDLYIETLIKPETVLAEDGTVKQFRQVKNIDHWKKLRAQLPLLNAERPRDFNPLDDNVYAWSDIHWDHRNIIMYSNRPFSDKNHMNKSLMENYYATITNEDIVIFGGDLAFTRDEYLIDQIHKLPGYKILIVGNHDINNSGELMKTTQGFDEVHLMKVFNMDGYQLAFTHYPLRPVPTNVVNVHGHIHTKLTGDPFHVNMCVEHTGYKPVKVKDLIQPALEMWEATK